MPASRPGKRGGASLHAFANTVGAGAAGGRGRGGAGNGGGARRGGNGGGRGGRSQASPPQPKTFRTVVADYSNVHYRSSYQPNSTEWDQSRLDAPGIDCVKFGREFSIDDAVLDILATRLILCSRLNTFIAGDADTGSGSRVSEQEFVQFIRNCPNMKLMSLDSHTQLGKDALLAIVESCPKLEALRITGHDRGTGKIDHRALAALATACEHNPDLAKNLRDLNLTDQHISHDNERAIKKLQKARKSLIIRTGETKGDHAWEWNVDVGPDVVYVKGKMEFFKPEIYFYS